MDGSAFESTQHIDIMKIIDDRLYSVLHKLFIKELPTNPFFLKNCDDTENLLDSWLLDAKDHNNTLFMCLPGVNNSEWDDKTLTLFRDNYPNLGYMSKPWLNFLYLSVDGCTCSGDPYTTLRNTVASMLYGYMYLHMSGVVTPWQDPSCSLIAAGDDLVIWCDKDISHSIRECSSTIKDGVWGIGQCIKEIKISVYDDFMFCSKWTLPGLYMVRDVTKMMNTK